MKKTEYRLKKDEIIRLRILKHEIKKSFLKSVQTNKQIKPSIRYGATYKIQYLNSKIGSKKNFCLFTGKAGSVYRHFNQSRHMININAKLGALPNVSINIKK